MSSRALVASDGFVTSPTFTDASGEAADCASAPTCAVTREDGTTLTAAVVDDPTTADGKYRAKLLAASHTSRLDWLTLTWTGSVTGVGTVVLSQTVEVVGGFYLSIPEMREIPGLENGGKVSAQQLRDACSEFEDLAEEYCGVAFVPRYRSERLVGDGGLGFLLDRMRPRSLVSVAATDTAGTVTPFTTTNWVLDASGLVTTDSDAVTAPTVPGQANVTIRYTYGWDAPPAQLVRAAKVYVQWQLLRDRSQVGRDIRQQTDPSGFSTTYSTADWDAGRPTGVADIDNVLNSLGRRPPTVG